MANRIKFTPQKRSLFFDELRVDANVTRCAALCGISRRHLYDLRRDDPKFRAAWDEAVEVGLAAWEDELTRRAIDGVDEPVFYQGAKCGTVKRYSDTLLIFGLKSRLPDKYGDRIKVEDLTGIAEEAKAARERSKELALARSAAKRK